MNWYTVEWTDAASGESSNLLVSDLHLAGLLSAVLANDMCELTQITHEDTMRDSRPTLAGSLSLANITNWLSRLK